MWFCFENCSNDSLLSPPSKYPLNQLYFHHPELQLLIHQILERWLAVLSRALFLNIKDRFNSWNWTICSSDYSLKLADQILQRNTKHTDIQRATIAVANLTSSFVLKIVLVVPSDQCELKRWPIQTHTEMLQGRSISSSQYQSLDWYEPHFFVGCRCPTRLYWYGCHINHLTRFCKIKVNQRCVHSSIFRHQGRSIENSAEEFRSYWLRK